MRQVQKYFSQFSFREYLAWTSEEENDEFPELDQFAAEVYNNQALPWSEGIEALIEYMQARATIFGEEKQDMLLELYGEYQEMIKTVEEDEVYILEMDDDHIISVYTRDE